MNVRVKIELLAPTMQYTEKTDLGTEECLANCYGRADFTGNRTAQVNWLSLSERIRWQ
jgi:hypothetical protein